MASTLVALPGIAGAGILGSAANDANGLFPGVFSSMTGSPCLRTARGTGSATGFLREVTARIQGVVAGLWIRGMLQMSNIEICPLGRHSVQSNMMGTDQVPAAMSRAYEANANLPLAERVLAAMKAAQKAGGDIRGQQAAAILVVKGKATGKPWDDNHVVDLRVEDNPKAMAEMERLLRTFRAYEQMDNGYAALENADRNSAVRMFEAAMQLSPGNLEIQYWVAIESANGGDLKKAASLLEGIYAKDPVWRELTQRVHKAGILKIKDTDLKLLLK